MKQSIQIQFILVFNFVIVVCGSGIKQIKLDFFQEKEYERLTSYPIDCRNNTCLQLGMKIGGVKPIFYALNENYNLLADCKWKSWNYIQNELDHDVAVKACLDHKNHHNCKYLNDLEKFDFDKNIPFILISHGWWAKKKSGFETLKWANELMKALKADGPKNVFILNWKNISSVYYPSATQKILVVSCYVGKWLTYLKKKGKLNLKNVHLIGHSLGGHLVGNIGKVVKKELKEKVGQITALDPAGPAFEDSIFEESRLSVSPIDAVFVDVIHTSFLLGLKRPCGTADFYPNFYSWWYQPGCSDAACSHSRSYHYYIESINTKRGFWSKKSKTFRDLNWKIYVRRKSVEMGYHVDKNERGFFYLETRAYKPYAKGK